MIDDIIRRIEANLEQSKAELCDVLENDVADMFGLPHTREGRALAMDLLFVQDDQT